MKRDLIAATVSRLNKLNEDVTEDSFDITEEDLPILAELVLEEIQNSEELQQQILEDLEYLYEQVDLLESLLVEGPVKSLNKQRKNLATMMQGAMARDKKSSDADGYVAIRKGLLSAGRRHQKHGSPRDLVKKNLPWTFNEGVDLTEGPVKAANKAKKNAYTDRLAGRKFSNYLSSQVKAAVNRHKLNRIVMFKKPVKGNLEYIKQRLSSMKTDEKRSLGRRALRSKMNDAL